MNYCNKCRFYSKPFLEKPKCSRISNYNVVKRKNVQFTLEESFKICTGYFFEQCSDENFFSSKKSDEQSSS